MVSDISDPQHSAIWTCSAGFSLGLSFIPWVSPGSPPGLQIGRVSCLLGIYTPCPLAPQLHFQDCCSHCCPLNWNCPSENHATLPRAYTQHPDSSLLPPNQSLGCLNSISTPPCMTNSVPLHIAVAFLLCSSQLSSQLPEKSLQRIDHFCHLSGVLRCPII